MIPDEDDDDAFGVAWEELTGEDPDDPVSYTHLDVYKRQGVSLLRPLS